MSADDRLDIMDLIARYAYTLDSGDLDGYVNNFAPDGVLFESHQRPRPDPRLRGDVDAPGPGRPAAERRRRLPPLRRVAGHRRRRRARPRCTRTCCGSTWAPNHPSRPPPNTPTTASSSTAAGSFSRGRCAVWPDDFRALEPVVDDGRYRETSSTADSLAELRTLAMFEAQAQATLPPDVWAFAVWRLVVGSHARTQPPRAAAPGDRTAGADERARGRHQPRSFSDMRLPSPIIVAPMGGMYRFHPARRRRDGARRDARRRDVRGQRRGRLAAGGDWRGRQRAADVPAVLAGRSRLGRRRNSSTWWPAASRPSA